MNMWKRLFMFCLACFLIAGLSSCGGSSPTASRPTQTASASPALKRSQADKQEATKMPASEKDPIVDMVTSMGTIKIELYPNKAPATVKNFLAYVNEHFYDGTIFHRVIPHFMIQGGGFTPDMQQKQTGPPVENEAGNGLRNDEGTIAMARTNVVNSATAQFFINTVDNSFLNHRDDTSQGFGYAVFGKVIAGMDVVHKIENVKTGNVGPFQNVPLHPVVIETVREEK